MTYVIINLMVQSHQADRQDKRRSTCQDLMEQAPWVREG